MRMLVLTPGILRPLMIVSSHKPKNRCLWHLLFGFSIRTCVRGNPGHLHSSSVSGSPLLAGFLGGHTSYSLSLCRGRLRRSAEGRLLLGTPRLCPVRPLRFCDYGGVLAHRRRRDLSILNSLRRYGRRLVGRGRGCGHPVSCSSMYRNRRCR